MEFKAFPFFYAVIERKRREVTRSSAQGLMETSNGGDAIAYLPNKAARKTSFMSTDRHTQTQACRQTADTDPETRTQAGFKVKPVHVTYICGGAHTHARTRVRVRDNGVIE